MKNTNVYHGSEAVGGFNGGEPGPQGPQGEQGEKGDKGDPGSATQRYKFNWYSIWTSGGFQKPMYHGEPILNFDTDQPLPSTEHLKGMATFEEIAPVQMSGGGVITGAILSLAAAAVQGFSRSYPCIMGFGVYRSHWASNLPVFGDPARELLGALMFEIPNPPVSGADVGVNTNVNNALMSVDGTSGYYPLTYQCNPNVEDDPIPIRAGDWIGLTIFPSINVSNVAQYFDTEKGIYYNFDNGSHLPIDADKGIFAFKNVSLNFEIG